jgi:hypothetical protein
MSVRGRPTKWNRWYSTDRWARIKKQQLLAHALCQFCLERGIVTPAEICDHIEPHHGDVNKILARSIHEFMQEVSRFDETACRDARLLR